MVFCYSTWTITSYTALLYASGKTIQNAVAACADRLMLLLADPPLLHTAEEAANAHAAVEAANALLLWRRQMPCGCICNP
jgi:hypothetical protein